MHLLNQKYSLITTIASYIFPFHIDQRRGKITPNLEVLMDRGKLLLNTNQVNYSYGALHDIFYKTFETLNFQEREIKKVLILGFGGGSIATLLTETFNKDCLITGIEADEVVVELAKKHFNIDRFKNLIIHIMDAYDFVLESNEKFDLVAIDIFVNDEIPEKFSGKQFLSKLGTLLAPSGIICYNRMIPPSNSELQEKELIKSFDQLIGLNFIMKYFIGGRTNWMVVHDRSL